MKLWPTNSRRSSQAGFSLIEVAISIAIVGFAMISLLGLMPLGLTGFKQAMTNTVESQIVQAITNDLELTSFSKLNTLGATTYSYDKDGNTIGMSNSATPIYTATLSMQPVSSASSGANGVYPVTLSNLADGSVQAYNVQITISNKSQPGKSHTYSVILANKNN